MRAPGRGWRSSCAAGRGASSSRSATTGGAWTRARPRTGWASSACRTASARSAASSRSPRLQGTARPCEAPCPTRGRARRRRPSGPACETSCVNLRRPGARVSLRVALGEDSFLAREGISRALEGDDDIDIVATCADYETLRAAVGETDPDVVLTDIRMPPTHTDEGIRLAEELRATHPRVGVVVLSQYAEPLYATKLLEHG